MDALALVTKALAGLLSMLQSSYWSQAERKRKRKENSHMFDIHIAKVAISVEPSCNKLDQQAGIKTDSIDRSISLLR